MGALLGIPEWLARTLFVVTVLAGWLWEQALPYYNNAISPHPDDDLGKDAMIDNGDWSMDWPSEFAQAHQFNEEDYPDWPAEWPATLRNFGRWLDMGRRVSAQS